MKPLCKYGAFIIFLFVFSFAAVNLELPFIGPAKGRQTATSKVISGSIISGKPSVALSGLGNTASIDYSPENNLTAGGGANEIKLWDLPLNTPVMDINPGEDFQVLAVRFLKGKNLLAAGGETRDNTGSIRIFNTSSGSLVRQLDDPEPIIALDVHPGGRYLLATGLSYIKIWDLKDRTAVSIIPKTASEAKGYFFIEGRYIVVSDSLFLYEWAKRERAGVLDNSIPLFSKKIHDTLYAWMSADGLSIVHAPHGRKEFVPIDTRGISAFDIAPDGKWGLLLKNSRKMDVIDLEDGKIVRTIGFNSIPVDVRISADGASAFVIRQTGNIDVFDIGSANTFRNIRFNAGRLFDTVKRKITLMRKKDNAVEDGL